ncbi:facilitated trehalose transporter Tret1 [Plutella xylostella]|uniref:facilitated trehalose transporter Tret1 n=1 Tax=Plutella xylostella TaxID=51655 RepID=UPI00203238FC|nr:facilitated trehalose transporter Tret1 [Plutella xylostella]
MTQPTPKRKTQYLAGICASLTFLFTGASSAWPSPALPKLKSETTLVDAQLSWIVSLTTIGGLPGCYIAQVLQERFGRKNTIFASAVPNIIGTSIILLTTRAELLYLARFCTGLGMGMVAVVCMIYITEIADKEVRGSLGMLIQVMMNLGLLTMYSIGPFVSYKTLNTLCVCLPVLYVVATVWIPESPYYHLKDGRVAAARKEFMVLKGVTDEKWVDEQLGIMRAHVRESMENKTSMKELFTNLRYRRALYITAGLKFLQYMTGSFAIQSYLELIFRQSSSVSGPLASIIYGLVQFTTGIAATFLTRYFGRRVLMCTSSLGVGISLTVVGTFFYLQDCAKLSPESLASISLMPLIGILGFNILYTVGIGNLPYVMQTELFPINVKTVASSTATMSACVFTFVVGKSYQFVKDSLGHYSVFWIFASVAYLGVFFVYFCVPETKGKTLEEIQDMLNVKHLEEAQALRSPVVTPVVEVDE